MKNTEYKKELKKYDTIIVYNRRSWFHRVILRITRYKAGHVALYVGDSIIIEAGSTGVKRKLWKDYTEHHRIYIARPKPLIIKSVRIDKYCDNVLNQRYAYLQLLMFIVKYLFKINRVPDVSKKALVCSEFVANAYLAAGIPIHPTKRPHEITPGDILDSDAMEIKE